MEYLVVPFTASTARGAGADAVATQLQGLIDAKGADGWRYVRLESVSTFVSGTSGCFGLGAQPGYMSTNQVAVFQR